MSEQNTIPILGIDKRPLNRQSVDGLCDDITNLRPKGVEDDPYWEAIARPTALKNANGNPFSHPDSDTIVTSYFYSDNANAGSGRKQRYIILSSSGYIDLIDPAPDGNTDWKVILHHEFSETAEWDASFAKIGEVVVASIVKDDTPFKLFYLYDDMLVPYGFPLLPDVRLSLSPRTYNSTEYEAGTYNGLSNGCYAWRYGFSINDEEASLSPPIPFQIDHGSQPDGQGNYTFSIPKFVLAGYQEANRPEELSFWEKILGGINIYLTSSHETKREALLNGIFYRIGGFNEIQRQVGADGSNPNTQLYTDTTADISTHEVSDVQTAPRLSANVIDEYNNRLLMGDVAVDFVQPAYSIHSQNVHSTQITDSGVNVYVIDIPDKPGDEFDGEAYKVYYNITLYADEGAIFEHKSDITLSWLIRPDQQGSVPWLITKSIIDLGDNNEYVNITLTLTFFAFNWNNEQKLGRINLSAHTMKGGQESDSYDKTFSNLPKPDIP